MNRRELMTAGATIRHESPFSALPVPPPPEHDLAIPAWQKHAFGPGLCAPGMVAALRSGDIARVDVDAARDLLTVFDWRHRTVGACLAAIKNFQSLERLIGTLLLRSDVCYAGRAYCLALLRFNSSDSVRYLEDYLRHYLTRPDLDFEQREALAALVCLDRMNGTRRAAAFDGMWAAYALSEGAVTSLAASIDDYTGMLAALSAPLPSAPSARPGQSRAF
jgi:hypothetical protein